MLINVLMFLLLAAGDAIRTQRSDSNAEQAPERKELEEMKKNPSLPASGASQRCSRKYQRRSSRRQGDVGMPVQAGAGLSRRNHSA